MEERHIASVDLGTSKIALSIAKVVGEDVQVVYYKESPSQGIRNSYVINPHKVETELRKAVQEAQQELKIRIQQVIVGLPRYEVRQETATARTTRTDEDAQITESEIRTLKSLALETYPIGDTNKEVIYGAVAQSFSTDDSFNELENDIIGMAGAELEGNFKVFVGQRRHSINIDNTFNSLGIAISKKYFPPGITARAVLKNEQMENGVALLDLGAGVSSVTIFKGKILRYYAAIPFGGNTITNDIKAECGISFELAENLKKAYGACMPNKLANLGEKIIQINDENGQPNTRIAVKYLSEIITARMREIIEALLYCIQESGYSSEDDLRGGVVITGGGANLVGCAAYIKELSGYSVKVAAARPFFSCEGCAEARDPGAATSMGMILAAKADHTLNCINMPPIRKVGRSMVQAPVPSGQPEETPAPASVQEAPAPAAPKPEPIREAPAPKPVEETVISPVDPKIAPTDDESGYGGTVFEQKEEEEDGGNRKKTKEPKPKKDYSQRFVWIKRVGKKIEEGVGSIFDDIKDEEV